LEGAVKREGEEEDDEEGIKTEILEKDVMEMESALYSRKGEPRYFESENTL